jgi:hypothetical protein
MMIPLGSIVTRMSYAKNGKPFAIVDSAILAEDEPGQGYTFERDGQTYMMAQIDKCQNWAVMIPPAAGVALDYSLQPNAASYAEDGGGGYSGDGGYIGDGGYSGDGGGWGDWTAPPGGSADQPATGEKPAIPAVPLPSSLWLLVASAAFGLLATKMPARRHLDI